MQSVTEKMSNLSSQFDSLSKRLGSIEMVLVTDQFKETSSDFTTSSDAGKVTIPLNQMETVFDQEGVFDKGGYAEKKTGEMVSDSGHDEGSLVPVNDMNVSEGEDDRDGHTDKSRGAGKDLATEPRLSTSEQSDGELDCFGDCLISPKHFVFLLGPSVALH